MATAARSVKPIEYPESDGKPMAENTRQFDWIVKLKENIDAMLPDFVAGDLFWYPVEGHPEIVYAPDVLVAFGRPKGPRRSYRQWEEGGVAPQVVMEVWAPSNRAQEKERKLKFYEQYGVEEYYTFDPENLALAVYVRRGNRLEEVTPAYGWVSPLLGIRFERGLEDMEVYLHDGRPFLSMAETLQAAEKEKQRAEQEKQRAEQERHRAEQEKHRADLAEAQLAALRLQLAARGISL